MASPNDATEQTSKVADEVQPGYEAELRLILPQIAALPVNNRVAALNKVIDRVFGSGPQVTYANNLTFAIRVMGVSGACLLIGFVALAITFMSSDPSGSSLSKVHAGIMAAMGFSGMVLLTFVSQLASKRKVTIQDLSGATAVFTRAAQSMLSGKVDGTLPGVSGMHSRDGHDGR